MHHRQIEHGVRPLLPRTFCIHVGGVLLLAFYNALSPHEACDMIVAILWRSYGYRHLPGSCTTWHCRQEESMLGTWHPSSSLRSKEILYTISCYVPCAHWIRSCNSQGVAWAYHMIGHLCMHAIFASRSNPLHPTPRNIGKTVTNTLKKFNMEIEIENEHLCVECTLLYLYSVQVLWKS